MANHKPVNKMVHAPAQQCFGVFEERLERIGGLVSDARHSSRGSEWLGFGCAAIGVGATCGAVVGSVTIQGNTAIAFWVCFVFPLLVGIICLIVFFVGKKNVSHPLDEIQRLLDRTMQQGETCNEEYFSEELSKEVLEQKRKT